MTAPEHISVVTRGLTFGALAWGDERSPLALLLHGYPDTAWTWRHLGPHLAKHGWRAVAPFTRGYGPTDLAPDDSYLVSDLAADALALHVALGGDERAVLIGHDWGAVTVWRIAEIAPTRFSKLVALSVPPASVLLKSFTSMATLPVAAKQARLSWYFLFNQLPGAERALGSVIPKLWKDWSPGYDAGEDLEHVFASLDRPGGRRAALKYYRDNLTKGAKTLFMGAAVAPALCVHGERDGCMQSGLLSAFPEVLAPNSSYVRLPDVGHFLHLEDPGRLHPLIDDWLR